MNIKNTFFLILSAAFASPSSAQNIKTSISWLTDIPDAATAIIYNPSQKLSIEDFQGAPEENSGAVAITSSGFMFKAGYRNKNGNAVLSIAVYCSFNKEESWMKERGKNAYILAHEQHHFDISYLSTLQFIKKVKQAKFDNDNYMQQLKDIYNETVQSMEAMQHQYDEETNNGINKGKQEEWNKKIEGQIAASAKSPVL